jgi:hypothetical protein
VAACGRTKQAAARQAQDHQQFETVDTGDDLRLRRDGRVERGTPGLNT